MKGAVFDIHGIRVRMEYRRIKSINLYVRPEQDEALVTVPFRTPRERVERFLYEKEGWMRRHLERTSGNREYPPVDREQIEKMRNKVLKYAGKWEKIMGVHATGWTLRDMKTRWGSCTVSTGRIRLNTRLIFYPEECLEYVIVHELCHLIEPSHNQQFKSCMTKFMPDWKERKRKLNGSHMDS